MKKAGKPSHIPARSTGLICGKGPVLPGLTAYKKQANKYKGFARSTLLRNSENAHRFAHNLYNKSSFMRTLDLLPAFAHEMITATNF